MERNPLRDPLSESEIEELIARVTPLLKDRMDPQKLEAFADAVRNGNEKCRIRERAGKLN
jgi:hypothetical protein